MGLGLIWSNGGALQSKTLRCLELSEPAALAYLAGLPEEEVEVEVVPVLPTAYIEAARRSEELRAAAAAAQQEAAASAREAARALLAAGLSTRDAALVMGVSHQRVAQLAVSAA